MQAKIMNFEELSDSKEMLNAKTPKFITFFILLILFMITAAFIWMWFGKIDIIIKAQGIVRPGKTISVIHNSKGGELKEINYFTGKKVNKGDILFSLDDELLKEQIYFLKEQINDKEENINNLNLLKKSIKNNENLFKDKIGNSLLYFKRYQAFKDNLKQIKIEYQRAKNKYNQEKMFDGAVTSKNQIKELKFELESAELKVNRFKTEKLINLKKEIQNLNTEVDELTQQLKKVINDHDLLKKRASISGTIQSFHKFNQGDYLPGGTEVLKIIPDCSSEFLMELSVKNEDIGEIEPGQTIKYRFLAFPYREYGILKGEIINISEDINEQADTLENEFPYSVRATIDRTELQNNRGEKVKIRPGMISEARVVTHRKKIFYVIMDKLDFIS